MTSVLDYGAIGDGETDDTAAFQAAVDDAWCVAVPGGVYAINRKTMINVPSDTRMIFEPGATLIGATQPNSQNDITALLHIFAAARVQIIGGAFVGDRATYQGSSSAQWGFGISIESSSDVTLDGCHIRECQGDGIYIGRVENTDSGVGCTNVTIRDCVSDNNARHGLSINKADGVRILGGAYTNSNGIVGGQFGIDIEPDDDCIIQHVTIDGVRASGNASTGIGVMNKALTGTDIHDVRIVNCDVFGNGGNGIDVTCSDALIGGCDCHHNTGVGISVRQANAARPVKNVSVVGCDTHHNATGTRLLTVEQVMISALLSHDNTARGLLLDGAVRCTADGLLTNNATDGLWITAASSLCTFDGIVRSNGGSGAVIDGNDNRITGDVSLSGEWGVYVTGSRNQIGANVASSAQGQFPRENARIVSGDRNRVLGGYYRKGALAKQPTYNIRVLATATNTLVADCDAENSVLNAGVGTTQRDNA